MDEIITLIQPSVITIDTYIVWFENRIVDGAFHVPASFHEMKVMLFV